MRDARPFLAHHLRQRANARMDCNGAALHLLARWVENLPSGDPRTARIARTDALDYGDGSFDGGAASEALIDGFSGDGAEACERWLDEFTDALASPEA